VLGFSAGVPSTWTARISLGLHVLAAVINLGVLVANVVSLRRR
jgi:hypothetical protein